MTETSVLAARVPMGQRPWPLARMQPTKAKDIREAIDRVAVDPFAPDNNLRALEGVANGFRIRVGDRHVSYTLDRHARVVSVFDIAPRGGAYR
jgi:mRNA interferase RelE/StbE